MCMSGEWPATQGAIFKSLPTPSTMALISRGAQMRVHTFARACYHVEKVCKAATSLRGSSSECKRLPPKKFTPPSGELHGNLT